MPFLAPPHWQHTADREGDWISLLTGCRKAAVTLSELTPLPLSVPTLKCQECGLWKLAQPISSGSVEKGMERRLPFH